MSKSFTNLPKLIASLPSSSTKPVLIKPTKWPQNSFYLVTRQELQFIQPKSASTEGGSSVVREEAEGDVKGKIWGLKYWQGHPYPRQSPKISDPKIPHSSPTQQWVPVDYSSLSNEIKERVLEGKKLVETRNKERRELLKKRNI